VIACTDYGTAAGALEIGGFGSLNGRPWWRCSMCLQLHLTRHAKPRVASPAPASAAHIAQERTANGRRMVKAKRKVAAFAGDSWWDR
jgi:hypothetical protein